VEYFIVKPEAAGGRGENTIAHTDVRPPKVLHLDCCFDDWLGDGLLAGYPCFIVRKELKEELFVGKFSGISFQDIAVSKSEMFYELNHTLSLPESFSLVVDGTRDKDDFWIDESSNLVVSSRALTVLREHRLANADIEAFTDT